MYWLDTNVFIEAKNTYYTFVRVPKFWAFLSEQVKAGTICSPRMVYDELAKGTDQLAQWVKARKSSGLCIQPTTQIYRHFSDIANDVWAKYKQPQAEEFLSGADGWVIAYVMHFGGVVVTQESRSRKAKVRIPPVCAGFNVACIDTFQMLDLLNAKF